ncbi:unnamed protein product (macronuclear) [Paramecium tetraurelia]|uniref:HTH myb-type domain-containing protein n=1 Tax=Paramecium tetraurelia TaxID=5888 RepID=A0D590_PARTE|nr:uncharacterized protein GSPATT00013654001 [Paramecium tetraurelia]CAK78207.1 unnamed protein product [Paramecium tetraurelia]|eukprot:XP_001445604.1 hypothetical protein (macronuclear) [Paramecium tetraurelia strain d4-2]
MDDEIFIKQPTIGERNDQSEQYKKIFYIIRQSQFGQNDESLEHLINSLIQNQQSGEDFQFKQQIAQKRINDQRFTYQEDKRILELVQQVGPNFNKIVKSFPGKTMNMIKNRYYKRLRYIKEDHQNGQEQRKKQSKHKKLN